MNRQQRLLVLIAGAALILMVVATLLYAASPASEDTRRTVQVGDSAGSNLEAGEAFLTENAQRPEVATSVTGLQFEVLEVDESDSRSPSASDIVVVNYRGTLTDGTQFDSSYDRGQPATFPLNQVIPGWTEGLQQMTVGDTFRFFIPPNLAYGSAQRPGIPANSVLIFDVELLDIVGAPADTEAEEPDVEAEDPETEVEPTVEEATAETPEAEDESEAEPTAEDSGS